MSADFADRKPDNARNRRCARKGHKFREYAPLPYVFCARWRCDVSAVSHWAPAEMAVDLHNAIPLAKRFPPVELDADGQVIRPVGGDSDE